MSHSMGYSGTVAAVNGKGFQLRSESGQEWFNLSKWNDVGGALPPVGAKISLRVDDHSFCRSWAIVDYPVPVPQATQPARAEQPKPDAQQALAPKARPARQEPPRGPLPSKDVAITRMNVLSTATAILSSGGRSCEAADVVKLAAKLEAWINR